MSCCEVPNQTEDIMEIYYEIERAIDWTIAAQSTLTDYDEPTLDDLDKAKTAINYSIDKLKRVLALVYDVRARRANFSSDQEDYEVTFEEPEDRASEDFKKLNLIKALTEQPGQEHEDLKQRLEIIRALTTNKMPYGDYPDPKAWSIVGK